MVIGHLRSALFQDFVELEQPGILIRFFYFITGLGHQAVIVFFVLSGYLVGGSVIRQMNNFDLRRYVVQRLSRLWMVLIPALVFTWLVDALFHQEIQIFLRLGFNSLANPNTYSSSFQTLMGNVVFLQTIQTPVFGCNAPLWSLANEFWYYLLFPCILMPWLKQKAKRIRWAYGFVAALMFFFLPKGLIVLFPIWGLGVVVLLAESHFKVHKRYFPVALIVLLIVLAASRFKWVDGLVSEYLIGAATALLMLFSNAIQNRLNKLNLSEKVATWLSSISYTMYLFHFPMIVLLMAIIPHYRMTPTLESFGYFASSCIAIISLSWAIWGVFEKNTYLLKDVLSKLLTTTNEKS